MRKRIKKSRAVKPKIEDNEIYKKVEQDATPLTRKELKELAKKAGMSWTPKDLPFNNKLPFYSILRTEHWRKRNTLAKPLRKGKYALIIYMLPFSKTPMKASVINLEDTDLALEFIGKYQVVIETSDKRLFLKRKAKFYNAWRLSKYNKLYCFEFIMSKADQRRFEKGLDSYTLNMKHLKGGG